MKTKTLNIALPEGLLKLLDRQARNEFSSRSEYIRRAIIAQLKQDSAYVEEIPEEKAEELIKRAQREKALKYYHSLPLKKMAARDDDY